MADEPESDHSRVRRNATRVKYDPEPINETLSQWNMWKNRICSTQEINFQTSQFRCLVVSLFPFWRPLKIAGFICCSTGVAGEVTVGGSWPLFRSKFDYSSD